MASFARRLASLTRIRLSTSKTPLQTIHRRGLADNHGPDRRPSWENQWLRESFVERCWGCFCFYWGYKLGAGDRGKKEED